MRLCAYRDRIAAGTSLIRMKVVYQASEAEQYDRQLTTLRHRLGRDLTRFKNAMGGILRRHNLEQVAHNTIVGF